MKPTRARLACGTVTQALIALASHLTTQSSWVCVVGVLVLAAAGDLYPGAQQICSCGGVSFWVVPGAEAGYVCSDTTGQCDSTVGVAHHLRLVTECSTERGAVERRGKGGAVAARS